MEALALIVVIVIVVILVMTFRPGNDGSRKAYTSEQWLACKNTARSSWLSTTLTYSYLPRSQKIVCIAGSLKTLHEMVVPEKTIAQWVRDLPDLVDSRPRSAYRSDLPESVTTGVRSNGVRSTKTYKVD